MQLSARFVRPVLVLVLLFGLAAGACSDGDAADGDSADGDAATGGDATDGTDITDGQREDSSDSDSDDPPAPSLEIPTELRARVEDSGQAFPEIDYPAQPDDVPWPTQDWQRGSLPDDVDGAAVRQLVADAFAAGGEADTIDAVLVVSGGELVVEEYNNWEPEARHASWSMAKSITQALVGRLVAQGELDPWGPAAAEEWQEPGDPRGEITIDQLLRMSSGLEWEESYTDPEGDVISILSGAGRADRAAYTADKPIEDEVDTVFEYSTGTADLVAREIAYEVGFGQEYVDWIQAELFDPLGIEPAEHQLDDRGVINGGSWVNLRPEDFARFGLLYLRGGEWDGEQLLPQGWVDYSRMPTPTDPEGSYGAHWWLIPERPGVFWASGYNGQSITVVPEEDLVVVVLSTTQSPRSRELRDALLDELAGPAAGA